MTAHTFKIQHVVDMVKTWSPSEQLTLIQAITTLLQEFYPLNGNIPAQEAKSSASLSKNGVSRVKVEDKAECTTVNTTTSPNTQTWGARVLAELDKFETNDWQTIDIPDVVEWLKQSHQ